MTPTLPQAFRRKWWIAITAILENLMFAAVLLGWSSLLLMLKNEGFFSSVCKEDNFHRNETENFPQDNTTSIPPNTSYSAINQSEEVILDHVRYTPSGYPTCHEQDEILNRYFSIGSSLLSGVTIILGVIMDKHGSRMIRLCGTWAFMISCILFAIGSLDTENYSILIAPAVCLNGMGGVVYIFTSFPVPNLFQNVRSTMISLMIGSYSASAVMYMIFKAAYDAGVPFVAIMLFHAAVGFLTFLNCYFNTPGEPIPGPDDLNYAIKLHFGAFRFEHKVTGKTFMRHASVVGRRMSNVDTVPVENNDYLASAYELKQNKPSSRDEMSFLKVIITPCVLLSFVTMCITQLRLIAYMGWFELYFRSSCRLKEFTEEETQETVSFYTLLFGLLQVNCFLMAPVIGTIMDWNLTQKKKKKKKGKKISNHNSYDHLSSNGRSDYGLTKMTNGKQSNDKRKNTKTSKKKENSKDIFKIKRKKQQIANLTRAFLLTNVLQVIFGIIILFEDMQELQILAFIIHTAVRTFLHSSLGSLYACMYHFSHFGKLTGLSSFLSAMFILIQDPLFVFINHAFEGDPYWINFGLLMFSISGFGLPVYLWLYGRRLKVSDISKERPLSVIREEEEEEEGESKEDTSDEEPAPILSSLALAL